jgi:thiosulfate/3-mercaptopyruvate sulfurtransferase
MNRALAVAISLVALWATRADSAFAYGAAYPRADLLVEASQLAQPQFAAEFVILDARPHGDYASGHVPAAHWVDHNIWARAFGHGRDSQGWSERIGGLGIGPKTKVIVYDDMRSRDAARIWWILRYWGVDDVRLLNGGWKAWQEGSYQTETNETALTPVEFAAKPHSERLATKEQLLASLGGQTLQIVDTRSERECCGVERLNNPRAGAIPGAKQLEWIDLIDKNTQRFKSEGELRQLFASAGISLDRPTATHCQSGGRASVVAFGMELMGAKNVSNYYPSWAEWSRDPSAPVVPGKPRSRD